MFGLLLWQFDLLGGLRYFRIFHVPLLDTRLARLVSPASHSGLRALGRLLHLLGFDQCISGIGFDRTGSVYALLSVQGEQSVLARLWIYFY